VIIEEKTEAHQRPGVLLLAAGRARRFGADKRKILLYKNEMLIEASVRLYRQMKLSVVVCLSTRGEDDALEWRLTHSGVSCLRCVHADQGMAHTLKEGVQRCAQFPGLFIALADMPLITSTTIAALEARCAGDLIVFPTYLGQRGHPVLFGSAFFEELETLQGDGGARAVLDRHAQAGQEVAVDDPGILRDLDSPGAVEQLRKDYAVLRDSGVSG